MAHPHRKHNDSHDDAIADAIEAVRRDRDALISLLGGAGVKVRYPGSFNCPFHVDTSPSACIELHKSGVFRFRCHAVLCHTCEDYFGVKAKLAGRSRGDEIRDFCRESRSATRPVAASISGTGGSSRQTTGPQPVEIVAKESEPPKIYESRDAWRDSLEWGVRKVVADYSDGIRQPDGPTRVLKARVEPGPRGKRKTFSFATLNVADRTVTSGAPGGSSLLYFNRVALAAVAIGGRLDHVFIVEGEGKADALATHHGVPAVSPLSGAGALDGPNPPVDRIDLAEIARAKVTCWPDPDAIAFMTRIAQRARDEYGCTVKMLDPAKLGLSGKEDAVQWVERNPDATIDDLAVAEYELPPAEMALAIGLRSDPVVGEIEDELPALVGVGKAFVLSQVPQIADAFVAQRFMLDNARLLHFYADRFYAWRDGDYIQLDDREIFRDVAQWLEGQKAFDTHGKFIKFPVTVGWIEQVTEMLRNRLYLHSRTAPPFWIEDQTPAIEWITCKTTMFDTDTGELVPRTPNLFTIGSLSFDPDLSGREPARWLSILRQQFAHHADQVDVMQEFAGYTLVDGNPFQKGLLIVGPTRSGKGEMIRTIEQLQPPAFVAAVQASTFMGGFAIAPIVGKRLVTVGDFRPKDDRAARAFVETLLPAIGGDAVGVDRKHKEAITARVGAKFAIAANALPRMPDDAGAIAQRLLVLKTQVSMAGREDFGLRKALDEELPLIFGWAWLGLGRLREQGRFTALNNEAADEMRNAGSVIREFVVECCLLDADAETQKDVLFDRFRQWSQDNNEPPMKHSDFRAAIETAFAGQVKLTQLRRQDKRDRFYTGVRVGMRIADPGERVARPEDAADAA